MPSVITFNSQPKLDKSRKAYKAMYDQNLTNFKTHNNKGKEHQRLYCINFQRNELETLKVKAGLKAYFAVY